MTLLRVVIKRGTVNAHSLNGKDIATVNVSSKVFRVLHDLWNIIMTSLKLVLRLPVIRSRAAYWNFSNNIQKAGRIVGKLLLRGGLVLNDSTYLVVD